MRHPKPFFRKFTQSWYVTIKGRQYPLGPDKAAAWQKYHELMAGREKLRGTDITVSSVCDAYLEWLKAHRSPGTYDKAVHYLSLFVKHVGAGFRVTTLDGQKVSEWIDQFPGWCIFTNGTSLSTTHCRMARSQTRITCGCRTGTSRTSTASIADRSTMSSGSSSTMNPVLPVDCMNT